MCTPASAFTVVALRALPRPPLPPRADPVPEPRRRHAAGLLLAALLAGFGASRDARRP